MQYLFNIQVMYEMRFERERDKGGCFGLIIINIIIVNI